jgi:hypothetical protein
MAFEPMGGFPPIVREDDVKESKTTLESRGFSTNIVSLTNIMEKKKKKDTFILLGTEEESGMSEMELNSALLPHKPQTYSKVKFRDSTKKKSKSKKK